MTIGFVKKSVAALSYTLLVAGCAGDSSGSAAESTTPATATTTTAAPVSTSSVTPGATTVDSPRTTTAPTTPAAPVVTTAQTSAELTSTTATPAANATSAGEYIPVAPPVVPGSTMKISTDDRRADGLYFAWVTGGSQLPARTIVFELVQLFRGAECVAYFGVTADDACAGDYGIETVPTVPVEVVPGNQFITVVDAATQQSYRVSGAELYELILGGVPSAGAPADYLYSGFGFLVTYEGGQITRLEQWWTP